MAGLKGANTTIGEDGLTITITTESEATARELQAQLETQVRTREGGIGAKANDWLGRSLNRFDETLGLYADRSLEIAANALMVCAMALAVFAWYFALPGYEIVMCTAGALLVFINKQLAAKLDREIVKQSGLAKPYGVAIIVILLIECVAAASLQSYVAVEQETGRTDIQANIDRLTNESNTLLITMAQVPTAPASAIDQRIEALKQTPAVNTQGTQLNQPVGRLVGDCTGASYYVRIYCPTLRELMAQRDAASAYEVAKQRFDKIGPEIEALQKARPAQSSTLSLGMKMQEGKPNFLIGLIIPVGLTLALHGFMLWIAYLHGRSKRTPTLELPPAPAATSTEGAV